MEEKGAVIMIKPRTRLLTPEEEKVFQEVRRGMNPNNARQIYDRLLDGSGSSTEIVVGKLKKGIVVLDAPVEWVVLNGHREAQSVRELALDVFRNALRTLNEWLRSKGTRFSARTESRGGYLVVKVVVLIDDNEIPPVLSGDTAEVSAAVK